MDETGVPLNPKPPKIVVAKGIKKPCYQSPGQKGQMTVVSCGNAAGNLLPLLIIFDTKNMQHAWTQGEVPGSKYGTSDKGWITTELFPNAVYAHPLLLLLDGHSTHYQPDVINLALKNEVLILPMQPNLWTEVYSLAAGRMISFRRILTKFNFNGLFSQAAVNPSNLIAGFKTCEVYPFNNQAVWPISVCENMVKSNEDSATESSECVEDIEEISPELEKKCKRRFEEGYDLCDPVCTCWLKRSNPESTTSTQPSNLQPAEPTKSARHAATVFTATA